MERNSGLLLHISSLPGDCGIGSMGREAFRFADFLHDTGQQFWQILPLGPTGFGNSPYKAFSAFAGNMLLIDIASLVEEGLLPRTVLPEMPKLPAFRVDFERVSVLKDSLLRRAFASFSTAALPADYRVFMDEEGWWLIDYCLYMALKQEAPANCWCDWEADVRDRLNTEMLREKYAEEIEFQKFVQYIFFKQWFKLKRYANERNVRIIGDMPLYVAGDSADVWTNRDIFMLSPDGRMTKVGGVPPDAFSDDGQLWGCPVYKWERLAERQYDWWLARLHFNLRLFDRLRIDHFRGLESFWAVAYTEPTAINGEWMPAHGHAVLERLQSQLPQMPLIAEDLGIITPEVEHLRDRFRLPGMKVLQFAFDSDEKNPFLPHNFSTNFIVYTGTHDNDTLAGWLKSCNKNVRQTLKWYFGRHRLHRKIMEAAWMSVAATAIAPMQDVLHLDGRSRMNTPGTPSGNWEWRFAWSQLKKRHAEFLKNITKQYNRTGK
ncbi:MAG: 4-alpha-glucanotransferase [Bacteroidales bacterium]|jgi:4-alpha-glucanotransferase|nr:4-alpha-glucanotransferase [Bacteroidales bacterium]